MTAGTTCETIAEKCPKHQAVDTLGNICRSEQNVKNWAVLEVVPAANESQFLLIWQIPRNPATDTIPNV